MHQLEICQMSTPPLFNSNLGNRLEVHENSDIQYDDASFTTNHKI